MLLCLPVPIMIGAEGVVSKPCTRRGCPCQQQPEEGWKLPILLVPSESLEADS